MARMAVPMTRGCGDTPLESMDPSVDGFVIVILLGRNWPEGGGE